MINPNCISLCPGYVMIIPNFIILSPSYGMIIPIFVDFTTIITIFSSIQNDNYKKDTHFNCHQFNMSFIFIADLIHLPKSVFTRSNMRKTPRVNAK
jgi:hypothetical protein